MPFNFRSTGKSLSPMAFVFLLAFSGAVTAQTTTRDAVMTALESNPQVREAVNVFRASEHDVGTARAGYLPSVDLSVGAGKMRRDYDQRDDYSTNRAELSMTQMLFDGFRTQAEVARLEGASKVRYLEMLDALDSVSLEVFETAENLVRYRSLLELARSNYQEHLSVQAQIRDRVEQGVGRRADLDQVEGRVALAESNLLTEASNLHDVTARYLRLVGELPPQALQPLDLTDSELPASIEQVLQAAYQGNPGFHAAIKNIAASQASVRSEKADYLPRLELRARYGTQQNLGVFDERFDGDDYGDEAAVELALTYNLFSGGRDRAAVKRSLAQVDAAINQRDQACVNLRQTAQIAYNDTRQLSEQLISLRRHRDASDRVRSAYTEQFQIGQRTLLDLLDAENEYYQSSRALINARHQLNIAYAQVLNASGRLLPALGIVEAQMPLPEGLHGDMERISVEPSSACPALSPQHLSRGDLITDVHHLEMRALFAENSSVLNSAARQRIEQLLAEYGRAGAVSDVTLSARLTPSSSPVEKTLANARVQAVRQFLLLSGLDAARVDSQGQAPDAQLQPATDRLTIAIRHLNG